MDFRKLAEDAARLGGQILQEWSTKFTAREKSPANLVTEADFASEEAIFGFLREHCPGPSIAPPYVSGLSAQVIKGLVH